MLSRTGAWEKGLAALQDFMRRENHCSVFRRHVEGDYKLGQWVAVQRYSRNRIAPTRKARLDEIGFVWSPRELIWEEAFAALKRFKAREGHCRVNAKHIEGKLKLGYWVSTQRRRKNKINSERKHQLDEIGFVWRLGSDRLRSQPESVASRSSELSP